MLDLCEDPNFNSEYNCYHCYCYNDLCVCHCVLLCVYVLIITPIHQTVNHYGQSHDDARANHNRKIHYNLIYHVISFAGKRIEPS